MNAHTGTLSEIGAAALHLAEQGFHVFPAPPGAKQGYEKAEHHGGRRWGATDEPQAVAALFGKHPAANVGIACQESGIFVIEGDIKDKVNGVQWLADEIEQHGDWPETVEALSPSGSWHIYFRYPADFDPKTGQSEIAPGVDVRGHGGMVIAPPSIKPGAAKPYRWKNSPDHFEIAECPKWLLEKVPHRKAEQAKAGEADGVFFDTGNVFFKETTDYHRMWGNASVDGKKHEATRDLAMSLAGQGMSLKCATGYIMFACPVWDDNLKNSIVSGFKKAGGNSFRHVSIGLVRDDKGFPIWCAANADALIQSHDDWRDVLGYNAFTVKRVLHRPIPGHADGKAYPRDLVDSDYTAALEWFNRNGFPKANAATCDAAVRKACERSTFDPLLQYLDGLQWDGVKRIDTWLQDYCNVMPETAEATAYTRAVSGKWMISAVARAYKPGCKADHMLVLEGEQGRRKSSVLAALAGPEWFSDSLPPMNTKDASSYLRGKWIVEVGELEAMRREVDAIKAFLSRQVESFRPAYGREEVTEPRRCVFAGSTNKDDWQKDVTGGRRFWPVKVGRIDVEGVEYDRDQLWAEAVTRFKAGEIWWLDGEAEEHAKAEVAARSAGDDPWMAEVADCIAGQSEIAIVQVLMLIGIPPEQRGRKDSDRVADILRQFGWARDGRFTSGTFKGQARYAPLESEQR